MMRINDYEGISVLPEVRVLPYTYGSTEVRMYLFSFVRKYFRKYFRAFVLSTFVLSYNVLSKVLPEIPSFDV